MNLHELRAYLGCGLDMVRRIVAALGIPPTRVSKSGKRRLYSLKSAEIRRVILEYNRLRDRKGRAGGQMRRRNLNLSSAERLERYWAWARQKNRESYERYRSARAAGGARAPGVPSFPTRAALVRKAAVASAVEPGPATQAVESAPDAPADGPAADAEGSGDLPLA